MSKNGPQNTPSCKFRPGVECRRYGNICENCGWNPMVEAKRVAKIKAERGASASGKGLIFTKCWG